MVEQKLMKLFVDDIRNALDKNWTVVRTYKTAIMLLETGIVKELSLDHDLGNGKTGYDVICWLEKQVKTNDFIPPEIIICHSSNPIGKTRIEQAIKAIKK